MIVMSAFGTGSSLDVLRRRKSAQYPKLTIGLIQLSSETTTFTLRRYTLNLKI